MEEARQYSAVTRLVGSLIRYACVVLTCGWAALISLPQAAAAQSRSSTEQFHAEDVLAGITLTRPECRKLERQETAVWVTVESKGYCARYYAFGLRRGANEIATGWINGDVIGDSTHAGHQDGLGVASMITQERRLSERYGVPFVFLPKPGTYGSAGKTFDLTHTRLEAKIVQAQVDAVTRRYGIHGWVLGGHSAGATLVAQLLAERTDVRCAVISSGVGAMREWRLYGETGAVPEIDSLMDPISDVHRIRPSGSLRVIVMADPRDRVAPWWVQEKYAGALRSHGIPTELLPLEKAQAPKRHSLVSLAEAATGECARGRATPEIVTLLKAMPDQEDRISN